MFMNFGRLLFGGVILFFGIVISVTVKSLFSRQPPMPFFPGAYPNFMNMAYAYPPQYPPRYAPPQQQYAPPPSPPQESPAASAPVETATVVTVTPRREAPKNRPVTLDVEFTDHKVDWRKPTPPTVEMVDGIPVIPKSTWEKLIPSFLQVREDPDGDPMKDAVRRWWTERVVRQLRGPMYPEQLEELIQKSIRGYTPGTEEFYATHEPRLRGIIPQGVLVPKFKPLMLPAQEEALIARYGWYRECEYLEYYGADYDEQVQVLLDSEKFLSPYRGLYMPDDWEDQIDFHLCAIEQHIGGYSEANKKLAFRYLALIFAIRNNSWGERRTTPGELTMSLFKFGISGFRRMLYETPSLEADQAQIEHAADAFEDLLNLIAVHNIRFRDDWLKHTPMIRVSRLPPGEREKLGQGWIHPSEIHGFG